MIEGLRTDSLWLIPDVIRVSQLLAAVTCVLALALYIVNARRVKAGAKPIFGQSLDGEEIDDIIEESPAESDEAEETAEKIDETNSENEQE